MRRLIHFLIFIILFAYQNSNILAQSNNNDSLRTDSVNIIDKKKLQKELSFEIINLTINKNQIVEKENLFNPSNIKINERDTLSMIIQLKGYGSEIIFNYYFKLNIYSTELY